MEIDKKVILTILQHDSLPVFLKALVVFFLGLLVIKLTSVAINIIPHRLLSKHVKHLLSKLIAGTLLVVLVILVLYELGFSAGIIGSLLIGLGLAIGFAGQETIGNIVAGFFLITENKIRIDDVIEVQGQKGKVVAINFLAVKIKMLSGSTIRIPNSAMMKTPYLFDDRELSVVVEIKTQDVPEFLQKLPLFLKDCPYLANDFSFQTAYTTKATTIGILEIDIPLEFFEAANQAALADLQAQLPIQSCMLGENWQLLVGIERLPGIFKKDTVADC